MFWSESDLCFGHKFVRQIRRVLLRRIAWTLEAMLRRTIPRQLFQKLRATFLLYRGSKMESNHDAGTSSPLQSFCTVVVS